jgi:hypothetical protein
MENALEEVRMARKHNIRAAAEARPAAIRPLEMQGRACRGNSGKRGLTPVAALSAAVMLTVLAPSGANALEAHSALAFRNSIGVNSVLSETGSDSRYSDVKNALREIGIVNHRAKLTPFNAWRASDLFQSSGVSTLARIDVRVGGGKVGKADPTGIAQDLNTALTAGSQALIGFEG